MDKLEVTILVLLNMLRTVEYSVSGDKGKSIMMVSYSKSTGMSNGTKKNMKAKGKAKKSSMVVSKNKDKYYECGNAGH